MLAEAEGFGAVLEVGPCSEAAQTVERAWRYEHRLGSCPECWATTDILAARVGAIALLRRTCQPSRVLVETSVENLDFWKAKKSPTWCDLGLVLEEVAGLAAMIALEVDELVGEADGLTVPAQVAWLDELEAKLGRSDRRRGVSSAPVVSDHT